jgi:flagellar biosynthetic protein FliQ
MTVGLVLQLASETLLTAAKIAAPVLLTSLVVGLAVSLFQSVTQIQDPTLTFVPKLLVIGLVLVLMGHWMLDQFTAYVHEVFADIPRLLGR